MLQAERFTGLIAATHTPFHPEDGASVRLEIIEKQAEALVRDGVKGVFTNTCPVDAYRGAGRPESIYCVERVIEQAAREFGMDPAELRRLNFVKPEQMPYNTSAGETYDSGDFAKVLDACLAKSDWKGVAKRKQESAAKGKYRGIGMCYYIESTMGDPAETAGVRFDDPTHVRNRKDIAASQNLFHTGDGRNIFVDQLMEQSRCQPQHTDPCLGDNALEAGYIEMVFVIDDQLGSIEQRPPDLEGRGVEGEADAMQGREEGGMGSDAGAAVRQVLLRAVLQDGGVLRSLVGAMQPGRVDADLHTVPDLFAGVGHGVHKGLSSTDD